MTASKVVDMLLEDTQAPVEVEYHTVDIDTMPHVLWMIRNPEAGDTQYIAQGTAHNKAEATKLVKAKLASLGVATSAEKDYTKVKK